MEPSERSEGTTALFSIVVPTRRREDKLRCLLGSFLAMTDNISRLEVILVVDDDDEGSLAFEYPGIQLQRVVVKPGLNMGELNMAGYERSSGQYVMLLNDDVIVRTRGWDTKVLEAFKSFSDEIVLVHVNDKIFEDKLCTFPFLSKTYCELAGGICHSAYIRYRIDDHIYNVFNLLSVLGRNRILYLPDVIFEHTNYVVTAAGQVEYMPNPLIHEKDTKTFDGLLPQRKELAVQLSSRIDHHYLQQVPLLRRNVLRHVTDSVSLRRPEFIRTSSPTVCLQTANTRVTIGIVSADLKSDHARACIDAVKRYTRNYDLIVLDNNGGPNFNHPREMNRILSICKTDYLVLMDDDVFVEPGWLDGMLRSVTPRVGVVTPLHKNAQGSLSYAGIVMRRDYSGHHTHSFAVPQVPTPIPTLCSAVLLIDITKCGHIRFDESYAKYFLDIDYGLRIWETALEVVCTPYTMVTHIGGGTLKQGSALSDTLFEEQRRHYVTSWIDTGRYEMLERGIWQTIPNIRGLLAAPAEESKVLSDQSPPAFQHRQFSRIGGQLLRILNVALWVLKSPRERLGLCQPAVRLAVKSTIKQSVINLFGHQKFDELKIKWKQGRENNKHRLSLAIELLVRGFRNVIKPPTATSFATASSRSTSRSGVPALLRPRDANSLRWVNASPVTAVETSYCGYSIYRFEYKYFAVEESAGPFNYRAFKRGEYQRCIVGHDLSEVHSSIAEAHGETEAPPSRLVLAYLPAHELRPVLNRYLSDAPLTILVSPGKEREWEGHARHDVIPVKQGAILEWATSLGPSAATKNVDFSAVIIPWIGKASWTSNVLEATSAKFARRIEVLNPFGQRRVYQGENLHRLVYNKAYLSSMFQSVGLPTKKTVLEVGCSDGLVCDIVRLCGAETVVGIDVMRTVGCKYQDQRIHHSITDGAHLGFRDESFDLSYSIATFEHVPDPYSVLKEMLRVTKVGGYCYVQAGPLYHSPFGHHMFAYFQDYPWAHLRKDRQQLNVYLSETRLEKAIERDHGMSGEEYIDSMLTQDHLNGLLLADYGLDEFKRRDDVKVLKFNISHEGGDMLTQQILVEVPGFDPENLVEHGFEIAFQRLK